jgi:hypothetical protein
VAQVYNLSYLEAELWRIMVRGQTRQISCETLPPSPKLLRVFILTLYSILAYDFKYGHFNAESNSILL